MTREYVDHRLTTEQVELWVYLAQEQRADRSRVNAAYIADAMFTGLGMKKN